MRGRIESWLQETHGAGFELVRHFLARFFDSDVLTTQGDWAKVAVGLVAGLLSVGLLIVRVYIGRYAHLQSLPVPFPYREGIRSDVLWFVEIAMCVTALLTALEWQSLFPSLRDCRALASLPVSARQIFLAKFGALVIACAALVCVLTGPSTLLLTAVSGGRWQENPSALANLAAIGAAMAGGCAFVFFGLLALQGILLNVLPGRLFARVSMYAQALVFAATLGAVPFLFGADVPDWPPAKWFLGLWAAIIGASDGAGASRNAALAVIMPPLMAVACYLLSYHRYQSILVEGPANRASRRSSRVGPRLLDRWIRDPREQAVFIFTWKSLMRSRTHRLVLLAYASVAFGCIVNGMIGAPPGIRSEHDFSHFLAASGPLTLAVFVTMGLRYLFALPAELRANWVFQITELDGRAAWLHAVERFVVWCGVVPLFLLALPAVAAVLGAVPGLAISALGLVTALVVFEFQFRRWDKVPFTCSYIPGKRPIWLILVPFLVGLPFLALLGQLYLYSSDEPLAFLTIFAMQAAAWWWLRKKRKRNWEECVLRYEETAEPDIFSLGIDTGGETPIETAGAPAADNAGLFERSMVASGRTRLGAWVEEIREEPTAGRSPLRWLHTTFEDVRFGLRLIRKSAALSAVLVLTLTVGIGMNVSVFTLINGIFFRARVADPGTFVTAGWKSPAMALAWIGASTPEDYVAFRDRVRSLKALATWSPHFVKVESGDASDRVLLISSNYFSVYGLDHPIVGRFFRPDEASVPGQAPVAMLGEEVWRSRFGADPQIVGKIVHLNDQPFTVVGVASTGHSDYFIRPAVWVPYTAQPLLEPGQNMFLDPNAEGLILCGRLAPGFSLDQARAELQIIAQQQDRLHPGRNATFLVSDGSALASLEEKGMGGDAFWMLTLIAGGLTMVLVITCANVTTLLLSKAAARQREIAVRLSLGAPRVRLLRMLVTESLLLAAAGGVASLYLGYHVPGALFQFLAKRPATFPLAPDWRIFAYTGGAVLATGVVAGLAPALQSLKVDLAASLKGSGSALGSAVSPVWVRNLLVSAQVALSLVLLVVAGLAAMTHHRMYPSDSGYPTRDVLTFPLRFPARGGAGSAQMLYRRVAERLQALPGASSVTYAGNIPFLGSGSIQIRLRGHDQQEAQPVKAERASPGYCQILGIPLVAGRDFRESDLSSARNVVPVILSESFLRAFALKGNPTGTHLETSGGQTLEVLGVAKDVKRAGYSGDIPVAYALSRMDWWLTFVLVRFDRQAGAMANAVRSAIAGVDPDLLVAPRTLQAWIDEEGSDFWRVVELVATLGLVAIALAFTGIYGAVAFAVSQRTRDLGIRVALGAQSRDIVREVLWSGGRPVVQGLLAGAWLSVAGAAAVKQAFLHTPYRFDTGDPLAYLGAALLLALAALLAMVGPARKGARSDPMGALRCE